MGPCSTRWYEDNNIPYVWSKCAGGMEYKDYVPYSGGRIDIYGLDYKEYYGGRNEYGLDIMLSEDWHALSYWLDNLQTETLWPLDKLLEHFECYNGEKIRWFKYES